MKYIVFLLMITITGYSQTIDRNNVIARQKLQYSGGNPDSNKLAVSVDANGIFKWVYFTDFQDSVNTGIYDTTTANVVVTQAIRITGATFASDTLLSIGSGGTVTKCLAVCDDIRWTTVNGTQTVLKDSTDFVGIGTSSPIAPFDAAKGGVIRSESYATGDGTAIFIEDATTSIQANQATTLTAQIQVDTAGIVLLEGLDSISIQSPTGKIITNSTLLEIDIPSASTGYVLTSLDASGNATWQDPTAYGEMGFGDSLRTIAITQNVFSVVTNTANDLWSTAAVDLHNVTYSGDSLIVDSAGVYQVNVQLSMDGTSNSVIRLGVFINGVLACSCTGYQELLNNRIIQLNYINIDQLNAGDVIQVVVTNTANGDDVDAVGGKLMVNKIR